MVGYQDTQGISHPKRKEEKEHHFRRQGIPHRQVCGIQAPAEHCALRCSGRKLTRCAPFQKAWLTWTDPNLSVFNAILLHSSFPLNTWGLSEFFNYIRGDGDRTTALGFSRHLFLVLREWITPPHGNFWPTTFELQKVERKWENSVYYQSENKRTNEKTHLDESRGRVVLLGSRMTRALPVHARYLRWLQSPDVDHSYQSYHRKV